MTLLSRFENANTWFPSSSLTSTYQFKFVLWLFFRSIFRLEIQVESFMAIESSWRCCRSASALCSRAGWKRVLSGLSKCHILATTPSRPWCNFFMLGSFRCLRIVRMIWIGCSICYDAQTNSCSIASKKSARSWYVSMSDWEIASSWSTLLIHARRQIWKRFASGLYGRRRATKRNDCLMMILWRM